jgi:hypothetical protein
LHHVHCKQTCGTESDICSLIAEVYR